MFFCDLTAKSNVEVGKISKIFLDLSGEFQDISPQGKFFLRFY